MSFSPQVEAWVARARAVRVIDELQRRGIYSRRMASSGAPCPVCGGVDRFSVNARKNLFFCRKGGVGGDAIALAQYLDGSDFYAAVETVTGEARPDDLRPETAEDRRQREAEWKRRSEQIRLQQEREYRDQVDYREKERAACHDIWRRGYNWAGSPVQAYLEKRGLYAPPHAKLRYLVEHPYWDNDLKRRVHWGPAMAGAMVGPDGRFAGVHQTWLDLSTPKGKLILPHPKTGEIYDAKKTRGSWKGATVPLVTCAAPERWFLGEGIETVLAVYTALHRMGSPLLEGAEFHSACNLLNIGGKSAGRVAHPTLRIVRKDGRDGGPKKVPGATPADVDDDLPLIAIPPSVRELVLLGDGDSDPFSTDLAMRRGGARFARAYRQLTVRLAMARADMDFNDMLGLAEVAA
ncbi:Zinc-binding domain of primase-helicase [Rhodoblastus acidophilus]|uniref:Zinc-binding domain of primase-helicase n=1 Tax=Rhodoblastus acidophilus TaxID=1074 RepID=A0A212SFB0_RHOAC|nr:DNA primase [Rhodoblastus acidophilus]PPQ37096.1 hypothetical protein CKO16_16020 [Rhodoblastus acidophilus]RAI16719.1 hypothetical protein CH337_19875 [Rhodoblastus acidophilus]SNB84255.1 Zinc-binding domain of primase-helicase [Rhodoblastus acidophilus]